MKNVNLVLLVEGGIVQDVITDVEGEDITVNVVAVDNDLEGIEEEDIDMVDGDEVYLYRLGSSGDSEYVKKVFEAIDDRDLYFCLKLKRQGLLKGEPTKGFYKVELLPAGTRLILTVK